LIPRLTLLFLSPGFADPTASAFGITLGKIKFSGNKTLAGLFGFVIASLAVLLCAHLYFLTAHALSWVHLKGYLAVAFISGVAELFSGALRVYSVAAASN
jgi:dolichol kinase